MTLPDKTIIVIGGGVAGLAAASVLSDRGFKVTLIEQRNRLGGRTFSFQDRKTSDTIDNGQHILMGCYQYTLQWLGLLGQTHRLDSGNSIIIPFAEPQKKIHSLTIPDLPMPFHLFVGILSFKNLSLKERFSLLKTGVLLSFKTISDQLSVNEWLSSLRQTDNAKAYFWNPVCLAVMNTSLRNASAKLFTDALKKMFLARRDHAKILIPKVGLTELFVTPSEKMILKNGGTVILNREVSDVQIENEKITEIKLNDGTALHANHYISAIPPTGFNRLFSDRISGFRSHAPSQIKHSSIISAYVWLKGTHADQLFNGEFIGCIHTRIQWIFKKSDHLLEITISDAEELIDWDRESTVDTVLLEMKTLFPQFDTSAVFHSQVIKERLATFNPVPGSENSRPSCSTPIKNLFLAGDWTDTGLPSTIESAVKSAYTAVECICVSLEKGARRISKTKR